MNSTRLVVGYHSFLRRIYACDTYYERVRNYLSRCRPHYRPHFSFGNVRVLFLSILRQGIQGKARLSYWRLLLSAAMRHRRSFGAAITLVVMEYHFQIMTERLSEADA